MSDIKELLSKNVINAQSILEKKSEIIRLSPVLDDITGGGFKVGTSMIITGIYKGGKTATCMHISKKFQDAGKKVYYCSIEHRLTTRDIKTHNVDCNPDKFQIVQSTEGHILSGEDFLRIMVSKLETESNILMIADSYSSLCSEELFKGDVGDRFRDPMPNKISQFCKWIASYLLLNNNTLIGITHEIANPNAMAYGRKTMEASGVKLQYAADFKLRVSHATPIGEKGQEIGQIINWECVTSALGPPHRRGEGRLLYDSGIDELGELIELGASTGIIRKKGPYLYIDDKACQGFEKCRDYLSEHPDKVAALQEKLASLQ